MAQNPSGDSYPGLGDEDPASTLEMTCALCGISMYQPTPYGKPVLNPVISHTYGSAARVQVTMTTGEQEADWAAGELSGFHICPACFEQKLIPWFETQGALPVIRTWTSWTRASSNRI